MSMNTTIEDQAKLLMSQHKNQEGRWDTLMNVQLSFYKRMYKYYKAAVVNIFSQDIETVQADNKELKEKLKDLEIRFITSEHNKIQLKETCILLQNELKKLKGEKNE